MAITKIAKYTADYEVLQSKYEESMAANGSDHPDTLSLMKSIAYCYRQINKLNEAEELYLRCLEIRKKVSGKDHTDTLKVMGLLALLYEERPAWNSKALDIYREVLDLRTKALGEYHKDTIVTCRNFGNFLYKLSKHRQALKMYIQYYTKVRTTRGLLHPDTWMAVLCILNARVLSKLPMNEKLKGEYKRVVLLLLGTFMFSILQFIWRDVLGNKPAPSLM